MSEPERPRDPRMLHTRPGPRLLALAGVALVFIFYRPGGDPGLLQSIVLPLIALMSAWYLTGSVVAIAFGVMLIAAAHSDRDSAALAEAVIYPGLALLAGAVLVITLLWRFSEAMRRRRAERRRQQEDT
ncbi:MAG: hypothetical protein JJT88_20200 [Gammaproteobacteria bacterium]|nr:hypothetical protein [Gammaproteobacteria bacterium]